MTTNRPTIVQVQTALDRTLEQMNQILHSLRTMFTQKKMNGFSASIAFAYATIDALTNITTNEGRNANPGPNYLLCTAREIVNMDSGFQRLHTWKLALEGDDPIPRGLKAGWSKLVALAQEACNMHDEDKRRQRRSQSRLDNDGTD